MHKNLRLIYYICTYTLKVNTTQKSSLKYKIIRSNLIKSDYQRKDEGSQISRKDMDGRATFVTIRNSDYITRWRIMSMLEVLRAAIDSVSIVFEKKRSEVSGKN